MSEQPLIYFVHCIDTEGPLDEDLSATFGRLKSIFDINLIPSIENLNLIQEKKIDFSKIEVKEKKQEIKNCQIGNIKIKMVYQLVFLFENHIAS